LPFNPALAEKLHAGARWLLGFKSDLKSLDASKVVLQSKVKRFMA
jgi:hypothetical protein